MTKIKPTVTFGIPAYLEGSNVISIVSRVLHQNTNNFKLKKVIIMLDGYEDEFSEYLEKYHNFIVKVIKHTDRKGKPSRINEIFEISDTDLVIILDTDVDFASSGILDNLVEPYALEDSVGLVSGKAFPKQPIDFMEKVSYSSVLIWEEIKKMSKNPAFTAEGTIRCFSKDLYKKLRFPNKNADDIYSYLANNKFGFKYVHQKNSLVNYRVPKVWLDFYRGQLRFLSSSNVQEGEFDQGFVNKNFKIKKADRITALLRIGKIYPIHSLVYVATWLIAKASLKLSGPETSSTWKILLSTKK